MAAEWFLITSIDDAKLDTDSLMASFFLSAVLGAIRQILVNVLDNAAKYGPIGQTITIGVRKEGGIVRLWVDDSGPGIPASQRENVWKAFFRIGGTVDDSTGGAGLGLSIVRDLATAMDARAELSESPGGGTRFTLLLHSSQNGSPS